MASEDIDPFAGKAEFFDGHYRSIRGRVRLELVLERLQRAMPPAPARILDAGGGTGAYAIPLAAAGHSVTLLDPSEEWLEVAGKRAAEAGVALTLVPGRVEEAVELLGGGEAFDAVLCHAVLMYLDDPAAALRALRHVARDGSVLSNLEKNRDGLSMRPGFAGDVAEARRVLDSPMAAGRLGIVNRAFRVGEVRQMMVRTGWRPVSWAGVRLFSDPHTDDEPGQAEVEAWLELEREVAGRDPYRQVARLLHTLAVAVPPQAQEVDAVQSASFAHAGGSTREAWPEADSLQGAALREFLERKGYGMLATTRPDGRPHAAMVAFVVRDGRLYLPAMAGAVRIRNLERDPRASFVVSEGEGPDHRAVVIEGDVELVPDPAGLLNAWLAEAWRAKFGSDLASWATEVAVLLPTRVLSHDASGGR
jgi:PPOX class probable F420-dependent enzyme